MKQYTLYGEGYSYLVPLLLSKNSSGFVHSRFANGFNIKMEDSLIFIGTDKNGHLPFGIHLPKELTTFAVSSVNNGDLVQWNEQTKSIELPKLTISLDKAIPFNNQIIPSSQISEDCIEEYINLLINIENRTGLNLSIRDFIHQYYAERKQTWDENSVEFYVQLLIEAALSNDELLLDRSFRYFLGRGNGLTPSGDDMIVGLLSFNAVSNFLPNRFSEKISELIEGESITTDVAREYLRYALRIEFSSTITDVVNAFATADTKKLLEAFPNLLGVGHSSGLDTLFGILIGIFIYKRNTEKIGD
ncbi:hypothetical protein UACE39S_06416 [Ureibacillus acetophenoni]